MCILVQSGLNVYSTIFFHTLQKHLSRGKKKKVYIKLRATSLRGRYTQGTYTCQEACQEKKKKKQKRTKKKKRKRKRQKFISDTSCATVSFIKTLFSEYGGFFFHYNRTKNVWCRSHGQMRNCESLERTAGVQKLAWI